MLRSKLDSSIYEWAIKGALERETNSELLVILNGSADNIEALRALKFVALGLDRTGDRVMRMIETCTHFQSSPQHLEWENEWRYGVQSYVSLVRLFVEYCDARIELLSRPLADASRLLASPSLEERRERAKRFDERAIMKYGFDGLA